MKKILITLAIFYICTFQIFGQKQIQKVAQYNEFNWVTTKDLKNVTTLNKISFIPEIQHVHFIYNNKIYLLSYDLISNDSYYMGLCFKGNRNLNLYYREITDNENSNWQLATNNIITNYYYDALNFQEAVFHRYNNESPDDCSTIISIGDEIILKLSIFKFEVINDTCYISTRFEYFLLIPEKNNKFSVKKFN